MRLSKFIVSGLSNLRPHKCLEDGSLYHCITLDHLFENCSKTSHSALCEDNQICQDRSECLDLRNMEGFSWCQMDVFFIWRKTGGIYFFSESSSCIDWCIFTILSGAIDFAHRINLHDCLGSFFWVLFLFIPERWI